MRDFIKQVQALYETEEQSDEQRAGPYPTRTGSGAEQWAQYIIEVIKWKQRKYGEAKWDGDVVEELGTRGFKVAKKLAEKGLLTLETGSRRIAGGNIGDMHFGRSGWQNAENLETFVLSPGPNFPR